jgi:DNA processing protein
VIAIGPADRRYPRRLLDLRDPPDPLWIEGDSATLARRCVSIVGTRRMTPYGARVARELASACATAGLVVVSGLAQGVDSAAHEGALAAGTTVAVLGAGIAAHLGEARGRRRHLAHAVRAAGALVSEFPPDAPARPWTFVRRDATIAALGEATVVVEAPTGSGALITVAEARKLRRPLYAVPGPIGSSASAGTNELIARRAACALTGAPMLLAALGVSTATRAGDDPDDDARVLDALAGSPSDPDALARQLGLSATALAAIVARLLIHGRIESAADGRLARRQR